MSSVQTTTVRKSKKLSKELIMRTREKLRKVHTSVEDVPYTVYYNASKIQEKVFPRLWAELRLSIHNQMGHRQCVHRCLYIIHSMYFTYRQTENVRSTSYLSIKFSLQMLLTLHLEGTRLKNHVPITFVPKRNALTAFIKYGEKIIS